MKTPLTFDSRLLNPPRGTRIFFGQELQKRKLVETTLRKIVESEGYEEILTPTLEHEEIFTVIRRAVNDKLYHLTDRSGRKLVLRPEMNAPVCRTIGLQIYKNSFPRKLYYFVPVFRYERSQNATYREFWQLGIEYIGADQPLGEAAIIHTITRCLDTLNIKDYSFKVSNLSLIYKLLMIMGVKEADMEKMVYKVRFGKSEKQIEKDLLDYGILKYSIKPLLDLRSKVLNIKETGEVLKNLTEEFPDLEETTRRMSEFLDVLEGLGLKNKVEVDFKLMRGTNHYNDNVFQIHHPSLSGDICGGGRYDQMVGIYSQNKLNLPAVGAAFGFDRIVNLSDVNPAFNNKAALIIPLDKNIKYIYKINDILIENGIDSTVYPRYDIKKALDFAGKNSFFYIVFIGKKEVENTTVSIRKQGEKDSTTIALRELKNFIHATN